MGNLGSGVVGSGEAKRRRKMIKKLGANYQDASDTLTGKKKRSGKYKEREAQETVETYGMDNQGIQQMHQQRIEKQDEQLDQIDAGIKRLREVGYDINVELDVQHQLLDDIDVQLDKAQENV